MAGIMELKEARPVTGGNILIIDALNLAFRYKHSGEQYFATKYIDVVKSLARSYDCAHVIITSDLGSSQYRLNIYPDYKGDRREKVANQTEEEKEEFEVFFEEFNNTLDLIKDEFPVLKYKGVEADDIAAYLTHRQFKDWEGDIWLVSSDKDWDLLLEDNVHRFSYVTRKEYTLENWEEHYDWPHSMAMDKITLLESRELGLSELYSLLNSSETHSIYMDSCLYLENMYISKIQTSSGKIYYGISN